MSAWSSSSLAASDHNSGRHHGGLMKNLSTRLSKQHLVEHNMFGSKRKGIQLGKKFKKSGKGIGKMGNLDKGVSMKKGGISPSIEEFDKMMSSIMGKKGSGGASGKSSMFSRKSFG